MNNKDFNIFDYLRSERDNFSNITNTTKYTTLTRVDFVLSLYDY